MPEKAIGRADSDQMVRDVIDTLGSVAVERASPYHSTLERCVEDLCVEDETVLAMAVLALKAARAAGEDYGMLQVMIKYGVERRIPFGARAST